MVDGGWTNQVRRLMPGRYGAAVAKLTAGLPGIPYIARENSTAEILALRKAWARATG